MFSSYEEIVQHQEKSIEELKNLSKRLEGLPKKLNEYGLQKLNSVCFVPAKIYHTNEILVHLGNDCFVERTSFQAREIVERRIKIHENNLNETKAKKKKQDKKQVVEIQEPIEPKNEQKPQQKVEKPQQKIEKPPQKAEKPVQKTENILQINEKPTVEATPKKEVEVNKNEVKKQVEEKKETKQDNETKQNKEQHLSGLQYALSLVNSGNYNIEDYEEKSDEEEEEEEEYVDVKKDKNETNEIREVKEEDEEDVEIQTNSTPKQKSNLKKQGSLTEKRKSVQFGEQLIMEPPKEQTPEEQLKEKEMQMKERIAKLDQRAKELGKTEEDEDENKKAPMENIMEKIKPKKQEKMKDMTKKQEYEEEEEEDEPPKKISKFKQRLMEQKK